jgi:hypothetical protein
VRASLRHLSSINGAKGFVDGPMISVILRSRWFQINKTKKQTPLHLVRKRTITASGLPATLAEQADH